MPRKDNFRNSSAFYLFELAAAVPTVITHRMAMMLTSGLNPTVAENREFSRMWSEKASAFSESNTGMWWQGLRYQQALLLNLTKFWLSANSSPQTLTSNMLRSHALAQEEVLKQGLRPLRKSAMANAKRLNKLKN